VRLSDPLTAGLDKGATRLLATQLGVHTVGDLLRHFPRRYERYGELTTIRDLPVGQDVTLIAEIVMSARKPMRTPPGQRPRFRLEVTVTDGRDRMTMSFFNAGKIAGAFQPGRRMLFSGTVGEFRGQPQLTHPTWKQLEVDPSGQEPDLDLDRPWAVYPTTAKVKQTTLRAAIAAVLGQLGEVPDPLPAEVRARWGLMGLREALAAVHTPQEEAEGYAALDRFTHEEAFVLQVALARRRAAESGSLAVARPQRAGGLREAFEARLPFVLTESQRAVGEQLAQDLAAEHPMHRLLQGEVGSGKTVVALRAMLTVVDAGGQAALLAPTEVLAAQHHRSITAMLGELAEGGLLGGEHSTRVVLLTGSMSTPARREVLLRIASGEAGIVVGTHALLQEQVSFADLGLVVVDEQHRFGVEQRDALRAKASTVPHLLVMTATPIPRTVAMTVFGDLEVSTMTEVPAGRALVATHVVPLAENPAWYQRVWARLREEVDAGHQAYVVCPRIEADDGRPGQDGGEGEDGEDGTVPGARDEFGGLLFDLEDGDEGDRARRPLRAVAEVVAELRALPAFAGLRIEVLHGRMPAEEREAVMRAFAAGQVQILVATTVIEVGVDVANATAMVVLDADRFGISQLHQLRGRVGRGSAGGVCLLVSDAAAGTPARTRVETVASTSDGFALARADLDLRREGDVLGARQSGVRSSLRRLRVLRDEKTIMAARHEATSLVAADPDLSGHPALVEALGELLDADREAYLDRG